MSIVEEAREIGDDIVARRQHLVAGAARVIGATLLATVVDDDFRPGGRGKVRDSAAWGLDGLSCGLCRVLNVEGTSRHPALRRSMEIDDYREAFVWDRRRVVPDAEWYRDPYFMEYVGPTGLDPSVLGAARLGDGAVLGVGAIRERHDPSFSDEDMTLLQCYLQFATRLWTQPAASSVPLPPRLQRLYDAMLTGHSEKEIADELGLSWHSVHTYARQLYRRLGVSSRAELMSRVRRRN